MGALLFINRRQIFADGKKVFDLIRIILWPIDGVTSEASASNNIGAPTEGRPYRNYFDVYSARSKGGRVAAKSVANLVAYPFRSS